MSLSNNLSRLPVYIGAGVISGAITWTGGYILPDIGWFINIYPGLVMGLALYLVQSKGKFNFNVKTFLPLLILITASVVGWRLAVEVGYEYGSPLRFTAAGALGGFSVAVGLIWVWSLRSSKAIVLLFTILTTAGAFGGWFFRTMHSGSPVGLGDGLWTFLLFVEWQVILFAAIWLARQIVKAK